MNYRAILYHKQATSARTRFLKFNYDSVCAFEPFPKLAQLTEAQADTTPLHPAPVLQKLEQELGLAAESLRAEVEYRHYVEIPGETIQVFLVNIGTIDPPFEQAESAGAAFIDLTQARGLPPVELELLRHAYELVLGG